jgi:hypothetical protein
MLVVLADMGQLPVFETYKQAAIRHQKAKDFAGALLVGPTGPRPLRAGVCSTGSR